MWGEVTPAERLRAVTRRNVDDDRLAAAAADALAGFADEPASLVVACRRVLAHHRAHGPLWWVCSRILAAADPAAAARTAERELEADRTGERLGATLPLLDDDEVVAAIGWPDAVDEALLERFDIDAVAVRVDGDDPTARSGAGGVITACAWSTNGIPHSPTWPGCSCRLRRSAPSAHWCPRAPPTRFRRSAGSNRGVARRRCGPRLARPPLRDGSHGRGRRRRRRARRDLAPTVRPARRAVVSSAPPTPPPASTARSSPSSSAPSPEPGACGGGIPTSHRLFAGVRRR